MASGKIFAGPRIRRLRQGLKLTQTAMAGALGISPSYLNLIERNQRPLTVQLILAIAETYDVDLAALRAGQEGEATLAELKAVFTDPLISDELPGDGELVEVAEAAPNVASGILKLHRAYREMEGRLSDLSAMLPAGGRAMGAGARLPSDEVQEAFETRPNHYPALEAAGERLFGELSTGGEPIGIALSRRLRERHDIAVRVLPSETMPAWRRRFDRHSRRLFLAERLPEPDRVFEIAAQLVAIEAGEALEAEEAPFGFSTPEARRLARARLLNYGALALILPYEPFRQNAQRLRYDMELLALRHGTSIRHVALRLTSLQRAGAAAPAFFFQENDHAGHRLHRAGARGFPLQRFGGACVKLPVHEVFASPGQMLVDAAQMPDGKAFLLAACTVEGMAGGFAERPRRTAVMLGLDLAQRDETVYGARLALAMVPLAIGLACRLCERSGCIARAEPPLTRPLALDPASAGLSPFDFS